MTPEEIQQLKNVEFYAASYNAWYSTRLEYDKSIFILSASGIGLLITLLTTLGLSSQLLLYLYIAAMLSFLTSLIVILVIFKRNSIHVERVLSVPDTASDRFLKYSDVIAILTFILGATLTAVIGISAAVSSFESKEKIMATENKDQSSIPTSLRESFNGISNLKPATPITKSFNGVANLIPQPLASSPITPPAPSVPAPAPAPAPSPAGSNTSERGAGS